MPRALCGTAEGDLAGGARSVTPTRVTTTVVAAGNITIALSSPILLAEAWRPARGWVNATGW
jgi:hypothetical protein